MRPIAAVLFCLLLSGCVHKRPAPVPPTQAQIDEAWRINSNPGEGHERIAVLEGVWEAEMRAWMSKDDRPEVARAVARQNWILGKMFIEEMFATTMMGQPFVGRGLIGFNNITGEYESSWADSMSSGQILSTGAYNPQTNAIELSGSYVDPVTKEKRTLRSVLRITDADHHLFEMYDTDFTGQEYKSLEISYTRRTEKSAKKKGTVKAAKKASKK